MTIELGFDRDRLAESARWLSDLAADWRGEIPLRLHESTHGGLGWAPPYSPEFEGYIGHLECEVVGCIECADHRKKAGNPNPRPVAYGNQSRTRASKAFRKLRRFSPREFDACYMYCVLGYSIGEISERLTRDDYAKGLPDPVTRQAVSVLLVSGIDKVRQWW